MDSDGLHEEKMTRATFWTEFLALADMGLIEAGPERSGGLVTAQVTPRGRLVLQDEIRGMIPTPGPLPAAQGGEEKEESEGDDATLES